MKTQKKFLLFSLTILLAIILPIISLFTPLNFYENNSKFDVQTTASATFIAGNFKTNANDFSGALNAVEKVKDRFVLSDVNAELSPYSETKISYGKVYKFIQVYKGFAVYGKSVSVTVNNLGNVLSVSGNAKGGINLDISAELLNPNLPEVLDDFGDYKINNTSMVIYEKNGYHFCYKLEVQSTSLNYCFVDAYTGELLASVSAGENLSELPTNGYTTTKENKSQTDAFGKTVTVGTLKYTETEGSDIFYVLGDSDRKIYMANNNNKTTYSGYDYYISSDGAISDSIAITAYVNLIASYDFFDEVLGKKGIANTVGGTKELVALVHYGTEYLNAAYVSLGSNDRSYFIFGDGGGRYDNFAKPLDIVGHEYTHAMTTSVTNFEYLNESGALSEGYSDIFGAMIEAKGKGYTMADTNFWLLAEDLFSESNTCLRNMMNPTASGNPTNYREKNPLCYLNHNHADARCDNGSVHSNCAIFTLAIYKMYQKGVVSDINSLAKLLYDSLPKLTETATIADAKEAILRAATEANYAQEKIVKIKESFVEVGVGSEIRTYSFYKDSSMSGTPIILSEEEGKLVKLPACEFENNGKYFWYWTNADGVVFEAGKTVIMGTEDASFYAVWSDQQLTVLKGEGTVVSPYEVNSVADLKTVIYFVNSGAYEGKYNSARFKLTKDLDLGCERLSPIGTEDKPFEGVFDGNRKSIKNLELTNISDTKYNGLFGVVDKGGYVMDVVIESGRATTTASYTGAIVGKLLGGIATCENHMNISSEKTAGGLVGLLVANGSIENSYNTGKIIGNIAGGLVGSAISSELDNKGNKYYTSGYVSNCYNTGEVLGNIAGGIAGRANGYYIVNCIVNGEVKTSASDGVCGGVVGYLSLQDMENTPLVSVKENVYGGVIGCRVSGTVSGTHGVLVGEIHCTNTRGKIYIENNVVKQDLYLIANKSSFAANENAVVEIVNNKMSTDNAFEGDFDYDNASYYASNEWVAINGVLPFDFIYVWKINKANEMPTFSSYSFWFNEAAAFDGYGYELYGYGKKDKPYVIGTAGQLAGLAVLVANGESFAGKYFKLSANIDLAGKIWLGIGMMNNEATDVNHPFSGNFDGNGYVIKNLTGITAGSSVKDENNTNGYRTMIYFGSLFGMTGITVQTKSGKTTVYTPTIKNVVLQNAKITGNYAGGIVGVAFSGIIMDNCYNINGTISSSNFSGGMIAYMGNNDADTSYTLVSSTSASITNCYNTSLVTGVVAGGIVGYMENTNKTLPLTVTITNCVNNATILGAGADFELEDAYIASSLGGIVGSATNKTTKFINCISSGDVITLVQKGSVGGIVGVLGHSNFDQKELYMSFVGCKVNAALTNKADATSEKIGALIGSSAGKSILTVNIEAIDKTHYLEKYVAFGKNITGGEMTSATGVPVTALVINSNSFVEENFDMNYEFDSKIKSLLCANKYSKIQYVVDDVVVYEEQVLTGNSGSLFIPTKDSTVYYQYEFIGWDKKNNFITGDQIFTALFKQSKRIYVVTYKDGNIIYKQEAYEAGDMLKSFKLSNTSDIFYDYEFVGWDKTGEVLSDLEVHAVYNRTMKTQGKLILIVIMLVVFVTPIYIVIKRKKQVKED